MVSVKTWSTATVSVTVAAVFLVAVPRIAVAQNGYPDRAIKIVVPVPPGPILDVLPRIIGEARRTLATASYHREPSWRRAELERKSSPSRIRTATRCSQRRPVPW